MGHSSRNCLNWSAIWANENLQFIIDIMDYSLVCLLFIGVMCDAVVTDTHKQPMDDILTDYGKHVKSSDTKSSMSVCV